MTTPMNTSIYNNAIQFAENEKIFKTRKVKTYQLDKLKSMEEIEDFLWVANANKVRSIIEYGDQ